MSFPRDYDWSDLPPELLDSIANKLNIHADYVRFRAVCCRWRDSTPRTPTHLPCQLPWLMLPQNRSFQSPRRGFFRLLDAKVHFLDLPEASNRRRRCGSSHGWLVLLDESPSIFIVNPLTRAKLNLPPLSTFPNVLHFNYYDVGREYTLRSPEAEVYTCSLREMRDSFIKKVVLSHNPSQDSNFIAVAILNQAGDLAYTKQGDNSWKSLENTQAFCEDIVFSGRLLYAVDKFGAIAACDFNGEAPRLWYIAPPRQVGGDMQYLVSAMDGMYLVTRYLELEVGIEHQHLDIVYKTNDFSVFRMNWSGPKWEKVTSLGDKILFLGENSSLALLASDFPGVTGNRIYFTDDYSEANYEGLVGDHDLGVYSLEDGKIEALPCYPRNSHSRLRWPPPIWVTPDPC